MALGVAATAQVNRVGTRLPQGFKKANAVATLKNSSAKLQKVNENIDKIGRAHV